jgi:hypothetical protein
MQFKHVEFVMSFIDSELFKLLIYITNMTLFIEVI